jgi:hypothetical protein
MAASGGFSFDFLPPGRLQYGYRSPVVQVCNNAITAERPFAWISNLPELLAERASKRLFTTTSHCVEAQLQNSSAMSDTAMASIGGTKKKEAMTPMDLSTVSSSDVSIGKPFLQATTTLKHDNDNNSNVAESKLQRPKTNMGTD